MKPFNSFEYIPCIQKSTKNKQKIHFSILSHKYLDLLIKWNWNWRSQERDVLKYFRLYINITNATLYYILRVWLNCNTLLYIVSSCYLNDSWELEFYPQVLNIFQHMLFFKLTWLVGFLVGWNHSTLINKTPTYFNFYFYQILTAFHMLNIVSEVAQTITNATLCYSLRVWLNCNTQMYIVNSCNLNDPWELVFYPQLKNIWMSAHAWELRLLRLV
jgi:hypothetical protein